MSVLVRDRASQLSNNKNQNKHYSVDLSWPSVGGARHFNIAIAVVQHFKAILVPNLVSRWCHLVQSGGKSCKQTFAIKLIPHPILVGLLLTIVGTKMMNDSNSYTDIITGKSVWNVVTYIFLQYSKYSFNIENTI